MNVDREWVTRSPEGAAVNRLMETLDCSPTLARILANRERTDPEAAQRYLEAPLEALADPRLLPDLDRAIERVQRALADDEQIVVFADRDIDGIAGCAILLKTLTDLGGNVGWYVPGKYDGYGIDEDAVRDIADRECDLVVTVDCGTNATDEIDLASDLGMDVVVTDHHDPDSTPEQALACVNPRREASTYPHEDLAGGGVAFKLGQALVDSVDTDAGERYRSYALPLVALATIGDYMALTLENRAIARAGYERLFDCGLPGLVQTAEHCDVSSISDLRWSLVPLLNASQAAESGDLLLKLLFAGDRSLISDMISQLEAFRDERRQKRQERQAHLEECFSRQFDPTADEHLVFLVETEQYVGGSAVTSLSKRLGRPVVTYRKQEDAFKGGGRSDPDVDFIELYQACEDLLEEYWGHPGAAGFTVPDHAIEDFQARLVDVVHQRYSADDLRPMVEIDVSVTAADLTADLVEEIDRLRPFGPGFDEPRFLVEDVPIVGAETFGGEDQHLRPVPADSEPISLVYWNGADYQADLMDGGCFEFVGELGWNDYVDAPQISVSDFRRSTHQ